MRILNRFKKMKYINNSVRPEPQVSIFAQKSSDLAIEYAKEFNKTLDYSRESIDALEEILEYYARDLRKSRPTDNEIWSMAVLWGSYLGQTMLKNGLEQEGFSWGLMDGTNVPLLVHRESYTTPNDKVYKRLINGPEDSVVYFYEVMMSAMRKNIRSKSDLKEKG